MQIKANGRAAFIIAAGLLTLYTAPALACDTTNCGRIVLAQNADPQTEAAAAPEPAATSDKPSRTRSHHAKKSPRSQKATEKSAAKSSEKNSPDKVSGADKSADQANRSDSGTSAVAPSVANANAQMAGPATTADEFAKSPSEKTGSTTATPSMTPANTQAAVTTESTATDQAQPIDDDSQVIASDQLNELDRAAATDQKPASKILRPVSQTTRVASTGSEDAWSQTSLIGKIFIGFGGLLTLASAARMFIA